MAAPSLSWVRYGEGVPPQPSVGLGERPQLGPGGRQCILAYFEG